MRWVWAILGVLIAALAAWEFIPGEYTIWDGGFDLKVHVSSTDGEIQSVRCKLCSHRDEVDFVLAHPTHPEAAPSAISDPFDGRPLSVFVPLSGRTSPLGREIARTQHYRLLVVVARLRNGREVQKVVSVPDSRDSREVDVLMP
jgi:hypothetical protein